jgi:flagellar hook-associated protein 1 FlgK
MSTIDPLSIAASGIANANRGLGVLSHNIANASTPGYLREVHTQRAATANGIAMGVASGPATRDVDTALQARLLTQNVAADAATLTAQSLAPLEAAHGKTGAGADLPALLANLETAFSTLAGDPSSATQQNAVVGQADALAAQIRNVAGTVGTLRQNAQDDVVAGVAALNAALARIGQLNAQIVQLRSIGAGTADLENARDQAVTDASSQVELRTMVRPNGELVVATTSGLQLPTLPGGPQLSIQNAQIGTAASYPAGVPGVMLGGVDVTAQFSNGVAGTGQSSTGQIGAALLLRDATLPGFQGELDEFAETLAVRFDQQGVRLFSDPAGGLPARSGVPRQSAYVGFANTIQVNPWVAANPAFVRDGTGAVPASPGGPTAFTPNPTGGPAGFTTLITRVLSFALGDQLAPGVPQPPPNLTGMGPAGTLNSTMNAPGPLGGFATALVARQTVAAGDAATAATAAGDARTALNQAMADRSGVNLDSELSSMMVLQNSYAANAKVMSTLQTMWSALLQAVQ